jgi:nucleotide-binding universal stress UspA family protein
LIATDGSPDARDAVAWLQSFPLPDDTRFLVVTVLEPPLLPAVPDAVGDFRQALLADARALVDDTRARLPHGAPSEGRVAEGDAREEIVAAATEWKADLVTMGARGLSAVKEFLLGSVSLGVARHAPCPVLVCKGAARAIRTVTIAQDGSPDAEAAAAFFAALPFPRSTRVRVIGVAEPVRYPSTAPGLIAPLLHDAIAEMQAERRAALERTLAPAVQRLRSSAATVDVTVTTGHPAEEIVRQADASGSDLVVIGARGLGRMKRLLLGSVSESVLRHAACPVLVVRREPIIVPHP